MCRQGSESVGFCWPLLNASKRMQQVIKYLLFYAIALLLLHLLALFNLQTNNGNMWTTYSFSCNKQKVTKEKHVKSRLLRFAVSLTVTRLFQLQKNNGNVKQLHFLQKQKVTKEKQTKSRLLRFAVSLILTSRWRC